MSEEEKVQAINFLAANPKAGGIRKVRFASEGKGKSGSIRIVYYFYNETMPLFLLAVFAKKERDNLSKKERSRPRDLVKEIRQTYGVR